MLILFFDLDMIFLRLLKNRKRSAYGSRVYFFPCFLKKEVKKRFRFFDFLMEAHWQAFDKLSKHKTVYRNYVEM